jgi:hypothetical protein
MDQRLSDALAFANYRLTLQVQRQNILARVETALLITHQGAVFRASLELISFVGLMAIRDDDLYVDDNSGNCHRIEDKNQFLDLLVKTYNNANKIKLEEQQKLKSARTTAKIVGL